MFNACRTTHIFRHPNCPPGRRTKPEDRLAFPGANAAIETGYRPCLVCLPIDGEPGPGGQEAEAAAIVTVNISTWF